MLRHKNIDRVCCVILALTLLVTTFFMGAAATGIITEEITMGYETRLFDQSRVHTIDIVMDDWDAFLETATSEEYAACHLVIDGESYKNVAIRGKGNTSLSSVKSYDNNRYSFKVEFDYYQTGSTYHGLDKLSLNNLIQDNTYMKDYVAYTLMNRMGVASPLCSFVQISVNGDLWGLYLAVEGVEDSFLQRNYGKNYGELYKPDSMSFGGGRGNGRDFDMDEAAEKFGFSFGEEGADTPDMGNMPQMPFGGEMPMSGGANPFGGEMPDMGGMNPFGAETMDTEDADGERKSRGMGGFGMGSNDVKLVYTDDDPASYTNIFSNAKTDITAADQARLIASLKALGEGDTSVVDTDAVIRYMVVHNFLCNDDSYTGMMVHNYYLYEEDSVLSMIPWDYNLAFGGFSGGNTTSTVNTSISRLVSMGNDADRPMAGWITASEAYTAQYLAAYADFISTVFDSGWFAEEIDRVVSMIAPYVQNDPTAFCTYEEFQTGVETLKQFCLKRAESVNLQLNGETAKVDAAELTLSDMGSMGRGMGGGMGFPGGDFNNPGRGRENRNGADESKESDMPDASTSPAAGTDRSRQSGGFTPPDAANWNAMRSMQPAQSSADHGVWLCACAALLASALLLVWRWPNKR